MPHAPGPPEQLDGQQLMLRTWLYGFAPLCRSCRKPINCGRGMVFCTDCGGRRQASWVLADAGRRPHPMGRTTNDLSPDTSTV